MTPPRAIDPRRFFLAGAGGITLWALATVLFHFTFGTGRQVPHILFLQQDFPALLLALVGLVLLSPFARDGRAGQVRAPDFRTVSVLILLLALWSWAGHYLVFQDYALSRDEDVAEVAAAYMRDGHIARLIPPEWVAYRRAIMPEFFSPYGATTYWAAAYLPVNGAIRALFWHLGDPNLSGPVLLAIGLFALWRVALRLFPDRPDAVWAVLLMAFTSTQLTVTAMTPYAMTGHFAFDMIWLALFLRGGLWGHLGAGLTAILAAGLHQWHFPPIFLAPFLFWLVLQRRWAVLSFHILLVGFIVWLWARFWPAFLLDQLGPPADIRATAGVGDKVGSLFTRLTERWQPLLNLSRLLAWNNILMVPLAVLGTVAMNWRKAIRGGTIALPLALGCLLACALALYQGYGWGFRYAHGFIGPFCLLAGFGWVRLASPSPRPLILATLLGLLVSAFLTIRAHDYVAPYAASYRAIRASDADVVLVDPRGGLFATDLVRTVHGDLRRPVVMNLGMLTVARLDALCASHDVALFDRSDFRPRGLPLARWQNGYVAMLRNRMTATGCGRRIGPS